MRFTKGGGTLSHVTSFPDCFVTAVGISPGVISDRTLFAAGYHGLFKSTDGTSTWTNTGEPARNEETQNRAGPLEEPPIIGYQGNWLEVTSSVASSNLYAGRRGPGCRGSDFHRFGGRLDSLNGAAAGQCLDSAGWSASKATCLGRIDDSLPAAGLAGNSLACERHTLTTTAQPASPVSIDAFDIWFSNCPLNYQL